MAAVGAFLLRGLAGDEEAAHYLMARYAPQQPDLFLSLVGRPLVTLALSLPAQAGLLTARIASALAVGAGAFALARLAGRTGWVHPLGVVALFLLQPFLLAHAGTAMTEPWTAALLAWGLLAYVERRYLLLAVLTTLLPMARLEAAAFLIPVAWVLIREARGRWLWVLPISLILWNLLNSLAFGGGLVFDSANVAEYPARPADHYLRSWAWVAGLGVFVPAVIGLVRVARVRVDADPDAAGRALTGSAVVLAICGITYTVFGSWIPITYGNLRYMAFAAPAIALLAAAGLQTLAVDRRLWVWGTLALCAGVAGFYWNHRYPADFAPAAALWWLPLAAAGAWVAWLALPRTVRRLAVGMAILLGVAGLLLDGRDTWHRSWSPEAVGLAQAAALLNPEWPQRPAIHTAHPLLAFHLGANAYDRERFPAVSESTLAAAKPGALFFWESHYTPGLAPALRLEAVTQDRRWAFVTGVVAPDTTWAGAYLVRTGPQAAESARWISRAWEAEAWVDAARKAEFGAGSAARAVREAPDDPDAWRTYADRLSMAGDHAGALSALDQATALDPYHPETRVTRAVVLHRAGRAEEALPLIREAAAAEPSRAGLRMRMGHILLDLGRAEEAAPLLSEAARQYPDTWNAQYLAGEAARRLEQWSDARAYYTRTLELIPDHPDAMRRLAQCETALDQRSEPSPR